MATNTINLSTLQSSSSLRLISYYSPKTTPNLSFYTRFRTSVHLSSVSSKPYRNAFKPRSLIIAAAVKTLSETEILAVPLTAEEFNLKLPSDSGVYAVYDKNDDLQFIGISRNIAASVVAHLKSVPELCGSVKLGSHGWKNTYKPPEKSHQAMNQGITTWVRQPPKKKPDLRLTPGRHVQLTVPLDELIDKLVKENKVVAFIKGSRSAPMCGFSQRVVGILESEEGWILKVWMSLTKSIIMD
ncbi:hypothetical protein Pint_34870 [Pistacia integerrima]|uniref:Uncharacterized protein n=1 Tax=Pistacia integerrima TaxID=434235 RepID=A0ACC0XZT6_9ROSI|nr:hypothetical protein Pint_34870 [Pistacia integerrima]